MRMSLQYSLVNQVLYAMDATITAKSLEWRQTHIRDQIQSFKFDVIDP